MAAARMDLAFATFSGEPRRIQGISPSRSEELEVLTDQRWVSLSGASSVIKGREPPFGCGVGADGLGGVFSPAWSTVTLWSARNLRKSCPLSATAWWTFLGTWTVSPS